MIEYTVTTGDLRIYQLITAYFDGIQMRIDRAHEKLLEENPDLSKHPHFERRIVGVQPLARDLSSHERPEDAVHMLLYKDKVIAVVTEQRNEFNNVQFSFFHCLDDLICREP
ncbi:MAG: hypothetical protein V1743_06760 [Nanoarchaeota archaeon]